MHKLDRYVENIKEIRKLSSLPLEDISKAEDYGDFLATNFVKIRILAMENIDILDKILLPLLASSEPLTDEQYSSLEFLRDNLSDPYSLEDFDLFIADKVAQRMMADASNKDILAHQIKEADIQIGINYSKMNYYGRVSAHRKSIVEVFQQGEEVSDTVLYFLNDEIFANLPDEASKEIIVKNSRYVSALYEQLYKDSKANTKIYRILKNSLSLCSNEFYNEQIPNYDWVDHEFRILKYFSLMSEFNNVRGFSKAQLREILKYNEQLAELWKTLPNRRELLDQGVLELFLLRNKHLNQKIKTSEYKEQLVALYKGRNKRAIGVDSVYLNMLLPIEFIMVLDVTTISEKEIRTLQIMYQNILSYIFSPNTEGILSFLLIYITKLLENFIEVPGGITFKDLSLNILAALHVPTYVHTHMVADITRCLTTHLITTHPELFAGMKGWSSVKMVHSKADKLIRYAYEAALCHDIGKIPMLDTILVYGRRLLDEEFNVIKQHPEIGAGLAKKHLSTRDYTAIIKGHHKWYNGAGGYPFDFDHTDLPEKTVIDIVMIADCLDAATDKIGRSYSNGKNLMDVVEEFKDDAGIRYSPYVVELFDLPEVIEDLNFLLDVKRRNHYEESYYLLHNMHEKER